MIRRAMRPTHLKRFLFFCFADFAAILTSLTLAFLIRFDFARGVPYYQFVTVVAPMFLFVKFLTFTAFKLYNITWRFVSLKDLLSIVQAVATSSGILVVIMYFFRFDALRGFPRGVLFIDAGITLILIATLRITKRLVLEVMHAGEQSGTRAIVLGAGHTGEMVVRDMQKAGFAGYVPVALLDDDTNIIGTFVHGIQIAGRLNDLRVVITRTRATVVIIAIPSLAHRRLRALYATATEAGVKDIKIVPRLYDVHHPKVLLQSLEDIRIEDLIGRQAVTVDHHAIGHALDGKSILITGAAGSIGTEIVRQVCRFNPRQVVCFEVDETELYRLELDLRRQFPQFADRIRCIVGDIRDSERIEAVFARYRPEVVFHAAAYKHVPMMETNASEAVKVNIVGTSHVVRAAFDAGTERFILISTDKAVQPTSIMGATKRIAEHICQAFSAEGKTEFVAVRFGNVLGSRGSVLPLFLEQLQRGGPITITHADMRRYFMTIPEAVSLVLQAGAMGRGGERMVLDMGDPVRIVELAEELIRLHGLTPYQDIDIEFIGMRPGEKLFEELLTAEEGTVATKHEKVFVARTSERHARGEIEAIVEQFAHLARFPDPDGTAIRKLLQHHVRWYRDARGPSGVVSAPSHVHAATAHRVPPEVIVHEVPTPLPAKDPRRVPA